MWIDANPTSVFLCSGLKLVQVTVSLFIVPSLSRLLSVAVLSLNTPFQRTALNRGRRLHRRFSLSRGALAMLLARPRFSLTPPRCGGFHRDHRARAHLHHRRADAGTLQPEIGLN